MRLYYCSSTCMTHEINVFIIQWPTLYIQSFLNLLAMYKKTRIHVYYVIILLNGLIQFNNFCLVQKIKYGLWSVALEYWIKTLDEIGTLSCSHYTFLLGFRKLPLNVEISLKAQSSSTDWRVWQMLYWLVLISTNSEDTWLQLFVNII